MKPAILPFCFAMVILPALLATTGITSAETTPGDGATDTAGKLHVPASYRSHYELLGVWAVAADEPGQGAKQMHEVYASPGAIAAYAKSGDFPDGTVLVKEVYATATEPMTTGTVSRALSLKGWFVMVRDVRGAHPGDRLWGDGWGWSWFDAADPARTTSSDYTSDCRGCHIPAQATHWIYVEGYPALRR